VSASVDLLEAGAGVPSPSPAFRPLPLTAGGHRQTVLGLLLRRRLAWTPPTEDLVVDTEPDALLVRASWQPGPREARPLLLIVHGLEGSDASGYALATGLYAWRQGWHVARMNLRGCGDSIRLSARIYNAGLTSDLIAVLSRLAGSVPRLAVAGFSLGGSQALLACGREPGLLPAALAGVAAVSPPLDLAACTRELGRPAKRPYQSYFMRGLRSSYRERRRLRPDLYSPGAEAGLRTLWAWDDAITAPLSGFSSAAEYYARSSAGPHLASIERPALVLVAADDPMIPIGSVTRWPLPGSGAVRREVVATGGHVGFVGRTAVPGHFWAAERILPFLSALVEAPGRR
jgi:uncharacterized protein